MPPAGTFMKHTALAGLAAAMTLLGGCMLDPVNIVLGAANAAAMASLTPEEVHATPADYRGYDCAMLANLLPSFQEELYKGGDTRIWQWHISAMQQVQAEKNCTAVAVAGTVPAATAAATPQPALDTPTRGVLGVRMDNLTAPVAEALGLVPARGVLTVEIVPGSGAARAGLKPMDVILEIAGQPVQNPAELQAIASRMRAGYQAPLQLWRERQLVEVNVEVMTAAALQAAQPTAATAPATPAAVATTTGPQIAKFCYGLMQPVGKPGTVRSQVWEDTRSDGSDAAMAASLDVFVNHVRTVQPGTWNEFPAAKCYPGGNSCTAQAVKHFVGTSQIAMLFCFPSTEAATTAWARFDHEPALQTLPWPQVGVAGSPANLLPIGR